ncbi:MAG: hypothetical protein JSS69_03825 [Acidobacteria bacterium]|nr:hypothetical protein [Acidobacteriota bacterium]MBS1865023.1 hypothetical protein [Acidobacteriota bacterium]
MPGIVGLISKKPREIAERELAIMLESVRHEDFYVAGKWINERLGVYAGWVAREGSFAEKMPVQNETRDITLMFSGEEFADPSTENGLRNRGHRFGAGAAEYLVHQFEEAPSFPSGLNGRFHAILIDERSDEVSLFNDRFGMHPLHFSEQKDGFYFACEAKAILAVRPELRQLDQKALGEFVACGSPLENRSLFLGISKLAPASLWTFRNTGMVKRGNYFLPEEWEEQASLDSESYFRELHRIFVQNLPRYFTGNSKIGMSLTGGLDTRMILACRQTPPNSLPCYTFGSMFRENHDVRVARRVAEACRQSFQVIPAGSEFLAQFSKYAERTVFLTDGCVDTSRSPDLYLNEKVREIAPVRMTGNYGGEVLRGVRAFKPAAPPAGLFQPDFVKHINEGRENFVRVARRHPVSFSVFQQGPWHHSGILGLEQTQVSMRSPFLDNDFVRTVFRSPHVAYSNSDISIRLIRESNESLAEIPTDRGLAGNQNGLSRILARTLLETEFKAEYAYDMGMPQWLTRVDTLFSAFHLERFILGRHKVFHFRIWFKTCLANYLREMLLDPRSLSRPYLERKRVEALVRAHVSGAGNFTNEMHKLLTLELLHRRFLDVSSDSVPSSAISTPAAANW